MPKVSTEYLGNKREMLLDAALRVCEQKHAYEITMKDVIRESGVSQGGIYRYFADIDDLFAALLNRFADHTDSLKEAEKILLSNQPPVKIIQRFCRFLAVEVIQSVKLYGKAKHELCSFYRDHPDRHEKIKDRLHEGGDFSEIKAKLYDFISLHASLNNFVPVVEDDELFSYISASFDGIVSHINASYAESSAFFENEEALKGSITLMQTFEKAFLLLLGVGW